jgi:hypothetical protein
MTSIALAGIARRTRSDPATSQPDHFEPLVLDGEPAAGSAGRALRGPATRGMVEPEAQ